MNGPSRVYMGWDSREPQAYEVAEFSLRRRASVPVKVVPLKIGELPMLTRLVEDRDGRLWCPISQAPMSTEFAVSRFCVPFLQRRGWALFVDCDVLFLADVAELFALADERYAVMCVKHRHESGAAVKMDEQAQIYYRRKNWSSAVLWNCGHPANKRLTLEMLNTLPGRDLHAFCWLEDAEIGELPKEWNYLVGVDIADNGDALVCPHAKLLHYTLGGPWLPGWRGGRLDEVWNREREEMECDIALGKERC